MHFEARLLLRCGEFISGVAFREEAGQAHGTNIRREGDAARAELSANKCLLNSLTGSLHIHVRASLTISALDGVLES